jgi:hypothetical protein
LNPSQGNTRDTDLFAASYLQLLAPQGTACPPEIDAWLRRGNDETSKVLQPMFYLRCGMFAQVLSVERAPHGEEADGRYWFSLAIAHHYLKQDSGARECFARGKQWLYRRSKHARIIGLYWFACELLEAQALRREAEHLIFN